MRPKLDSAGRGHRVHIQGEYSTLNEQNEKPTVIMEPLTEEEEQDFRSEVWHSVAIGELSEAEAAQVILVHSAL